MIKIFTAFTTEIEDGKMAVNEIITQLDIKKNMLKNTIGIITFDCEYIETGVYKEVAESLPFDIVGCCTTFIGTDKQYGDFAMSVTMITSDDICFDVKLIKKINEMSNAEITKKLNGIYSEVCSGEKPKMIMPFMSVQTNFSGDDLVDTINNYADNIPMFGTLSFNIENEPDKNYVVYNNIVSSEMIALVSMYGDFKPTFRVTTSLAYEERVAEVGLITDAEGAILKSVNKLPVTTYLKKLGVVDEDNKVTDSSIWSIPAIIEYDNGVKVARAFVGEVENSPGYIYAAGNIEKGAKVAFSFLDSDKTLESASKLLTEIEENGESNFIGFSCAARSWSLGSKYLSEVQRIAQSVENYNRKTGNKINYSIAYSAGEICPVPNKDGKLINCLHNYTFIACSFN